MAITIRFQLDISLQLEEVVELTKFGFRIGKKGTHTSRTIMLEEISQLLAMVPSHGRLEDYRYAVVENNCLGKRTFSTRKLTFQRLREIYGLDPGIPIFRIMRDLWYIDSSSQPQLACLMGLARDPLFRITMPSVIKTQIGEEIIRSEMKRDLFSAMEDRFNESILDKIVRNALSSWAQSGHLQGRVRKIRQKIRPTPIACAYALLLAFVLGKRGPMLFESPWVSVFDASEGEIRELAVEAKRLGLLDLKEAGNIIDISFPNLLMDKGPLYGTHR